MWEKRYEPKSGTYMWEKRYEPKSGTYMWENVPPKEHTVLSNDIPTMHCNGAKAFMKSFLDFHFVFVSHFIK
jgi:hypothetical protein